MKTKVFNLIILDESGSMQPVVNQTIGGCNETINGIKSTQAAHSDSQEHLISIYAFQTNDRVPSRYLVKNVPAEGAQHITGNEYRPWGSTPLYDAIGSCLAELKISARQYPDALGSVTIITDGYENSSTDYNLAKVRAMISELKELGWNFNFIGANIDVEKTARSLNIDAENALGFQQTESGTKEMWAHFNASCGAFYDSMAREEACDMSPEERIKSRTMRSKKFFSR